MKKIITKQKSLLPVVLGLIALPVSMWSQARQQASTSEQSYKHARQVLEAGLQALGSIEATAGVKNFTVVETGKHTRVEHPNPEPGVDIFDWSETVVMDFAGGRLYHEIKDWNQAYLVNGSEGYLMSLTPKIAAPLRSPSLHNYLQLSEKLPQFLLRDALNERAASLRALGEAQHQGRKQQVIAYVDRSNRQVSLYFDAQTHLLTKYEFLYTDGVTGDTLREHIFPGYRRIGSFQAPTGLIVRQGGRVAQDVRYERLEFNSALEDAQFSLPKGCERVPPFAYQAPAPLTMTRLAEDVYLLHGVAYDNNTLVVAFNDFILVVESPELGAFNRANELAIAKIKDALPGKPIKYHTFTHYHADHGGGARAYIAEGSTIITTPGNKAFIEQMAAAKFTMLPDALAKAPRKPIIQIVEGKKHVLRDDRHVVELYDIGPYPHVKEELIIFLPQHKLLFEGDLFTSGNRDEVGPATSAAVLLAEKIKQLGLNVEKIVGMHGRLRPIQDLQKAIEKRNRLIAIQSQIERR